MCRQIDQFGHRFGDEMASQHWSVWYSVPELTPAFDLFCVSKLITRLEITGTNAARVPAVAGKQLNLFVASYACAVFWARTKLLYTGKVLSLLQCVHNTSLYSGPLLCHYHAANRLRWINLLQVMSNDSHACGSGHMCGQESSDTHVACVNTHRPWSRAVQISARNLLGLQRTVTKRAWYKLEWLGALYFKHLCQSFSRVCETRSLSRIHEPSINENT